MENPDLALEAVDIAIQKDPGFLAAYIHKCALLQELGRDDEALETPSLS